MITPEFAQSFAAEWIAAFNSRDLERILSHYTDDFEMSSPFILSVAGEATGTLKGRAAVGAYWAKAMERRPDLNFRLVQVYAGVRSVVIHYQRHDGSYAAEYFEFAANGKVSKSSAHYVTLGL